jgi:hypothetical protein
MLENTQIVASYKYTFDELQAAEYAHSKQQKAARIIVTVVLITSVIGLIVWKLLSDGIPTKDLISAAILLPILFFLCGFTDKYFRKKQFSLRGDSNKQVVIKISQHEIASEVVGIAANKMSWDALAQVSKTDKGFLFYTKLGTYLWIPNHAFPSNADIDLIVKFSKQLTVKFVEQK